MYRRIFFLDLIEAGAMATIQTSCPSNPAERKRAARNVAFASENLTMKATPWYILPSSSEIAAEVTRYL